MLFRSAQFDVVLLQYGVVPEKWIFNALTTRLHGFVEARTHWLQGRVEVSGWNVRGASMHGRGLVWVRVDLSLSIDVPGASGAMRRIVCLTNEVFSQPPSP